MNQYFVEVSWTYFKAMEVYANSPEEAAKIAFDTGTPTDGNYSKGSFKVDKDAIEIIAENVTP